MLRTIFVLIILVPGLVAALRSRFYALLLYVWWALFRPDQWLWFDVAPYRPSLVLGLLVVVPTIVSGILPNITHPLSLGAIFFLLTSLVAQVNAVAPDIGWQWIDYLSRLLVICLLSVNLIRTRKQFVLMLAVIGGSFGFHSAKAGLMSLVGGGVRFGDGLAGAFVDNNGYALGTAMIIPFLVFVAQNIERRWLRAAFWAAVPLSMFTIVSTYSRGGALALLVAGVTFIMLQRRRAAALVALTAICLLALLVMPFPKGYAERIRTIQSYDDIQDDSALGRLHFWAVAMDMASRNRLGIGLRNFEAAYDRYDTSQGQFGHARAVHSSHFEVLAENGYLGAAIWASLFLYAFLLCRRIRARARDSCLSPEAARFLTTAANALITSMMAFLIGGAFIALSLNDLTWLTFALVATLDRMSVVMLKEVTPQPALAASQPAFSLPIGAPTMARVGPGVRVR